MLPTFWDAACDKNEPSDMLCNGHDNVSGINRMLMSLTGMQSVEEQVTDMHTVMHGAQVIWAVDVLFKSTYFWYAHEFYWHAVYGGCKCV